MKKKNDMERPSIEELQFLQALNSSYRKKSVTCSYFHNKSKVTQTVTGK